MAIGCSGSHRRGMVAKSSQGEIPGFIGLNEDQDALEYFGSDDKPLGTVPIKDIVLIAKHMTTGGWWGAESDVVIVTAERGDFYCRSVIGESAGLYIVLKRLAKRWKSGLELESGSLNHWSSAFCGHPNWPARSISSFERFSRERSWSGCAKLRLVLSANTRRARLCTTSLVLTRCDD